MTTDYGTPDPQGTIEDALLRNDMARVIVLALASQGYVTTDSPNVGLAFLGELEACGYTLRLTTSAERRAKNDQWGPSR